MITSSKSSSRDGCRGSTLFQFQSYGFWAPTGFAREQEFDLLTERLRIQVEESESFYPFLARDILAEHPEIDFSFVEAIYTDPKGTFRHIQFGGRSRISTETDELIDPDKTSEIRRAVSIKLRGWSTSLQLSVVRDIARFQGRYFVVGDGEGSPLMMQNGVDWEEIEILESSDEYLLQIANNETCCVALIEDSESIRFRTSEDGRTWQNLVTESFDFEVQEISYVGEFFIASGSTKSLPREARLLVSTDGLQWTEVELPRYEAVLVVETEGENYVLGTSNGHVLESQDILNWQERSFVDDEIRSMAFANGQWIVAGRNGIFTSPNLVDWNRQAQSSTERLVPRDDHILGIDSWGFWRSDFAPAGAPDIVTHPVRIAVPAGQVGTLSVVSLGQPPLTYQWYLGTTGDESNPVEGANHSHFTTVLEEGYQNYWVKVSNEYGSDSSFLGSLIGITQPSIFRQPEGGTFEEGNVVHLRGPQITGGAIQAQWYFGESGNRLKPVEAAADSCFREFLEPGRYLLWLHAWNDLGEVESETVEVYVRAKSFRNWAEDNSLPTDKSGVGALLASAANDAHTNLMRFALGLSAYEKVPILKVREIYSDGELYPGGSLRSALRAHGAELTIDYSEDLKTWEPTNVETVSASQEKIRQTFRTSLPASSYRQIFFRLRVRYQSRN